MLLDDFVRVGDYVEFRAEYDDEESNIVASGTADHYDSVLPMSNGRWTALVDDAVHEINMRWGIPLDDSDEPETEAMDAEIVRETAEAILRPIEDELDAALSERNTLQRDVDTLLEAIAATTVIGTGNVATLYEVANTIAKRVGYAG
jgi:hypothetical protein